MDNKSYRAIIVSLLLCAVIFAAIGGTFAYFSAQVTSNENDIHGQTYQFDVGLNITTIKNDKLIPLDDDLVDDTLNSTHVCTDARGYGICSLYQVTFNNTGAAQTMTGVLMTESTTYTTSNLKYQLFTYDSVNTEYTAVSDAKTVPTSANGTSAITLNNSNVNVSLSSGTTQAPYTASYYLAIWLSDPGSNQLEDSNQTYSGVLTFTSSSGGRASASFTQNMGS